MKLLFDCTELSYYLDNSGHRAGVFNVSLNLFREFIKNKDIEITFVCDFSRYYFMREIMTKYNTPPVAASFADAQQQHAPSPIGEGRGGEIKLFHNIKLLEEHSLINKFLGKLAFYTDKMPIHIKYGIRILSRFYDRYCYRINKRNLEQLKDFNVYFSPFSPPSKEIERVNMLRVRMLHDAIPIIENGMPKSPKDWYFKIYSTINEKDFYVTNSNCTKKDILKYFPFIKKENIKTTYLGVSENYLTPTLSSIGEGATDLRARNDEETPFTPHPNSLLQRASEKQSQYESEATCVAHPLQGARERQNQYESKVTCVAPRNDEEMQAKNDTTKYIFSLCSLGKRKNLEFCIRNFFAFIEKNEIKDLKLVLGGSIWEKYKPVLNKIIKEYDASKIILTGYINEEKLADYYSNALCFIFPSLYEGFGLPVLEAMACGCPVITSNTSSLPEVIGDAGIQIDPTNDNDMIKAYEKMYFDSDFRNECTQKGLERAKQFSWEKCASELFEFMKTKSI